MAVRTRRRRYSPRMPREERREQLLDTALRVIASQGFGGLSMEGVAREADIAKTVVYDLFGNQDELLQALFEREQERALADVAAAIPAPPLDREPLELLVESLVTVLDAVRSHPETWRLILLPADGTPPGLRNAVDDHRDRLTRQIEPMVAWGVEKLDLAALDAELTAHALLTLFENAIRLTLTDPDSYPPQRLADFARELVRALTR